MPSYTLSVNGQRRTVTASPDTPLLWVLRDLLGLTGPKFGCGIAQCRACTVHLNDSAVFSCQVPVAAAEGQEITTIEGLSGETARAVQQAWIAEDVPQCGYCQPGQIMTAVALLRQNPNPGDQEIDEAMAGHICRCGTYNRVRRAIRRAAKGGAG